MYIMWCSLCVHGVLCMACICTLLGIPCVYTVLCTWPVCYGVLLVCTQYFVHYGGVLVCTLYSVQYGIPLVYTWYSVLYMACTLWGSSSLLCVHDLYVTGYTVFCIAVWLIHCGKRLALCVCAYHCILYSCIACSYTVVDVCGVPCCVHCIHYSHRACTAS